MTFERPIASSSGGSGISGLLPYRSGQNWYYRPNGLVNSIVINQGDIFAGPFWVPGGASVDQVGVEVTGIAVGEPFALGLYGDSGYGYPSALLSSDAAVSQDVVGSLAFVGFFVEERIPLDFFASAFPNA